MTDPDWEPVLKRAAAVVTEQGGRTCHAAIVSRELGLPCVVGTGDATRAIRNGAEVTVSCAEGDEGRVYEGKLPFEREEIDPATLPTPARPDHAQRRQSPKCLPARGPAQRRRRPGADRVRRVELDRDPSDGAAPPGAGRAVRGGRDPEADGRVGHARRVLRGSPGHRRRPDRRGVLPAAGDRALLRLQDQRVRGPPGRRGRSSRSRTTR